MSNANARVTMLEQQVRGLTADLTVEREAREKAQAGLDDARERLIVQRDRADAAEAKLAEVLRRVREAEAEARSESARWDREGLTLQNRTTAELLEAKADVLRAAVPEAFKTEGGESDGK